MKVKKVKISVISIFLPLLIIIGCATTVKLTEFSECQDDLRIASHALPLYIVEARNPRVAILPMAAIDKETKKCGGEKLAVENIYTILGNVGGCEIVERSEVDKIMQEVRFQVGIGENAALQRIGELGRGIDYVILGTVSTNIASSFKEARRWKDKEGKVHYEPPKCEYNAGSKINLRMVSFPGGTISKTFEYTGSSTTSTEVRDYYYYYHYKCYLGRIDECGLISGAINNAFFGSPIFVDALEKKLKKAFPSYGYIIEVKTHRKTPEKRVVLINLGDQDGIIKGSKIQIIRFKQKRDPVKGNILFIEDIIGEGKAVEVFSDKAWCLINDPSHLVRIKDAVKTEVRGIKWPQ
ncbi:MAG: hypothetical protein J7L32_05945 [Thermoplasmata archaeon]|nr:hypothetical protein [Thermoplasmata archaeon]